METVAMEIREPLGGTSTLEIVTTEIREPLEGIRALEIIATEIRGLREKIGPWVQLLRRKESL